MAMANANSAEDNIKMMMVWGAIGRLRRCIVLEQFSIGKRWLGACFKSCEDELKQESAEGFET